MATEKRDNTLETIVAENVVNVKQEVVEAVANEIDVKFDLETSNTFFRKGFPLPLIRSEVVTEGMKFKLNPKGGYATDEECGDWQNLNADDVYEVKAAFSVMGGDEYYAVFLVDHTNPDLENDDDNRDTQYGEVYLQDDDFKFIVNG